MKKQKKEETKRKIKRKKQPVVSGKEESEETSENLEQESNILEVTEKAISRKMERVSTGIHKFDSFIEGGFVKNSTNLLVGGSGAGKSIFAVQFLITGMMKNEKCLYVTFEEKKQEFYSNMLRFGWDLEKLEKQGKFFFLEYTPEKVRTMLEEGGGAIENIVLTQNISRMIIDSITSFELLFSEDLEKRSSALALFNLIRKWDCTALLTYEGSPSPTRMPSSRILDFESDSITLLHFVRGEKERERFLEILKMRGTSHSLEAHPFSISKSGILIGNGKITKKPLGT
jgi:circadian clock protein KaiC